MAYQSRIRNSTVDYFIMWREEVSIVECKVIPEATVGDHQILEDL